MQQITKKAGLALAYPAVWALSVAAFWLFMSGSDAMGYVILFIWIINPVAIFAVSFLIGSRGAWGKRAWIAPVVLGAMYMLLPYATFSLANTLSSGNINPLDVEMALFGMATSVLGIGLGALIRRFAKRVSS